MKSFAVFAILFVTFAAEARFNETPEDLTEGREACQNLLYTTSGRNPAIQRVREILLEDYAEGLNGDQSLSVSSLYVTSVDATVVEFLARELQISHVEAARDYSNSSMLLASAYGTPGKITPAIRAQTARGLIHASLNGQKIAEAEERLKQLLGTH